MALNELATNAIKYGALSAEKGSVAVGWSVQRQPERQSTLILEWNEFGGPRVSPPTRRGFGTRLMERCIERDLGGKFDLVFKPAGVACRISIAIGSGNA